MKLFDYQKDGIRWMVGREMGDKHRGGFLCDEMGLGKTIQTLVTMSVNRVPKTLIIVPNSLVDQWSSAIAEFTDFVMDKDVSIVTYSKFSPTCKMYGKLMRSQWDRVILDEGHEIRTKTSKRFKAIDKMKSGIRWVLSGTPIYNKKADYLTLLNFVTHGALDVPGINTIMLRRTKEDVKIKLPTCHFENLELEMYPEEWSVYTSFFSEFSTKIGSMQKEGAELQFYNMYLIEALLRVRQLCVHPNVFVPDYDGRSRKMDVLLENILSHPEEKSIIFCQFHKEMNIIQEMVGKHRKVFRLDGSVHTSMRQSIIDSFKKTEPGAVFIIQIKTGGQGLNIQEATRVYIMAPAWNPATELQAIARCHRTGQTKEVFVKKFIYVSTDDSVNSVDESIVALQDHKSTVCAEVLNDERIKSQIPVNIRRHKFIQILRKIFDVEKKI
jgi:SNF2 family DNA or RNA helicase